MPGIMETLATLGISLPERTPGLSLRDILFYKYTNLLTQAKIQEQGLATKQEDTQGAMKHVVPSQEIEIWH